MNTAAMNTLKQIRDAKKEIQDQLHQQDLEANEKKLIQEAIFILDDEEDIIIGESLNAMVDILNAKNSELIALIDTMTNASDKIAAITKTIQKIAGIVSVLAEITGKALSAGIL